MYNVAFAYTRETGGYEGVVTWTCFESKEAFDKWYTDDIKSRQRIVEEGISSERCVELVRLTPAACYIAAAFQESEQTPELTEFHIHKAAFSITSKIIE